MNILPRLLLLATVLVCAQAWAVPGSPAWSDSIDPLIGDSSAGHVVTAGDIAYVAGAGPFKGTPKQ